MDLWSLPMPRNFWKQQIYASLCMPAIHLQVVARKHRRWQKYLRCLVLNYGSKNLLEWKCRCRLDIYTFIPMCVYNNIMTSWCFWCTIYAQNSNACMKIVWSSFTTDLKMSIAQFPRLADKILLFHTPQAETHVDFANPLH